MILVTGGAGFIGSHTCAELIDRGYDVVIVDDFSNSKPETIDRLEEITGKAINFVEADVCDRERMDRIFKDYEIDAVIHFAGKKAVGESVEIPLEYYRNNLDCTLSLCESMQKNNVKKLIFSSSATVYRATNPVTYVETGELGSTNPYGWTKFMIEQILRDLCVSEPTWSVVLLRYFNPIGAHPSGLIGEDPNGIPNNLMPYIARVASGKLEKLHGFGNDYPTRDGTGVRDYIHVVDLARGHVKALDYAEANTGAEAFNLGTGTGSSVLEVVKAFEKASGITIPYVIDPRRSGDLAEYYADPTKAKQILHWEAEYDIERMCADVWRFERMLVKATK
jgi:UDP-glucose 4-epimerase